MTAPQELSKGALGIFAALRMADPSAKLIDSTQKNPTPPPQTSEMLQCKCRNKREGRNVLIPNIKC